MGATRIGIIAEGPVDHALLPPLLQQVAGECAGLKWPVRPDDVADILKIRKRGHGGVVVAVRRLIRFLQQSHDFADYAFFVIVLDRRTPVAQKAIRKLIRGNSRFVLGIAIEEIEAWWLGDRKNTLAFLQLKEPLPSQLRYAQGKYKAEKDAHPKKTIDELTVASKAVDSRYGEGNTGLTMSFVTEWGWKPHLANIEGQCPKGFGRFRRDTANAFRRAQTAAGTF